MNTTAPVKPTPEQIAQKKQDAVDRARIADLFANKREAMVISLAYQLHREDHADSAAPNKPAWADSRALAEQQFDVGLAALQKQVIPASLLATLTAAAKAKGIQGDAANLDIMNLLGGEANRTLLGAELGITDADVATAREAGLLREFLAAKLNGYKPVAAAPPAPPPPEPAHAPED